MVQENLIGAEIAKESASGEHLIYNTTTWALSYDADGSGAGAGVQFALKLLLQNLWELQLQFFLLKKTILKAMAFGSVARLFFQEKQEH